jgi:hypothetical protein
MECRAHPLDDESGGGARNDYYWRRRAILSKTHHGVQPDEVEVVQRQRTAVDQKQQLLSALLTYDDVISIRQ